MYEKRERRHGFTMIELIFAIVVIGILAVVALPKLAATRDDALMVRKAHAIMTSASEIAAYTVAGGKSESDLSIMSNTLAVMIGKGEANQTNFSPPTIEFSWKDIDDCIVMRIEGQGSDTEVLVVEANGTHTSPQCNEFRSLIDKERFPIPLHGQLVSY